MSQISAGWYPDGNGNTRYWDGSAWTEHVQGITRPEPPPHVQQQQSYQRSSYMNSGPVTYDQYEGISYPMQMTPEQNEHTKKMQKRIMGIVSLVIIVPFFLFIAFFIFMFVSTGGEGGYRQDAGSVTSQLETQIESQIGNGVSDTQCFVKESETQAQDLSGMVRIEEGRVFTCTFLDEVTGETKTADMVITTLDTNHESILDTTWTSYATSIY